MCSSIKHLQFSLCLIRHHAKETHGNLPYPHVKWRQVVRYVGLPLYRRYALHRLLSGPHSLHTMKTEQSAAPTRNRTADPSIDQPVAQSLSLHLPRHSGSTLSTNSIKILPQPKEHNGHYEHATSASVRPTGFEKETPRTNRHRDNTLNVKVKTTICQVKKG
jgi:hypothetical protein